MSDRFRPLRRLPQVGWIAGVCAGTAYSLGVPTWLVRMLWVVFTISGLGFCLVLYLLLWIFLPVDRILPPDYAQRTGDTSTV